MKKAMLSAVLMLALSLTLLAGSTYAWFTDSYTNTGNQISFANFEMTLEFGDPTILDDNGDTKFDSFQRAGKVDYNLMDLTHDNNGVLVQPGSVVVRHVKISNKSGNIDFAARHTLEKLWLPYADVKVQLLNGPALTESHYVVVPAGEEVSLVVTLTVATNVGNEFIYQKRIPTFNITFEAEQLARAQQLGHVIPFN